MNRRKIWAFIILSILIYSIAGNLSFAADFWDALNDDEQKWLLEHRDETFSLGLDPYSGMDYFNLFDQKKGYLIDVVKLIEQELNIHIDIIEDQTWGEVYSGLLEGRVDILFGANVTEERLKMMAFTEPIIKNPYIVFAQKNPNIQTIGDLDRKRIGFIEGDIIIDAFPKKYFNIKYETLIFQDQDKGLEALNNGLVDGFVTSGGGIEYEFLYQNPDTKLIAEINSITSDMTLSTLKENQILINIINKVLAIHEKEAIKQYLTDARIDYNRKVLRFTKEEVDFLTSGHKVVIGVPNDYLPFEYASEDSYLGISGVLINEVAEKTGLDYTIVEGSFSELYDLALSGDIEMLSMAKTEDRLLIFDFTQPYCEERDIIVGKSNSERIQDVYDLEGKKVAVIEGFWHEEYLRKNLYHVDIVQTDSLVASLEALESGGVDYLIENPTVVQYYIDGLGYKDLIKRGTTSKDSFFYFGVDKNVPEVVSIIDKTLRFINIDEVKEKGLQSVPTLTNKRVKNLLFTIAIMSIIIVIGVLGIAKLINVISFQKAQTELLKEREKLLYFDALSGVYNRQYFVHKEKEIEAGTLPQAIIVSDLDNLKYTNDRFGHHVGDLIIAEYGRILRLKTPQGIVIRMGGDEFLMIVNGMDEGKAISLIQEIKSEMNETILEKEYIKLLVASFGYVIRRNRLETIEESIKKADVLMYQEKNVNKNIVRSNGKDL